MYRYLVESYQYHILRFGDLKTYEQDSKVQFVIDAVYAFAHALDALRADVCPVGWRSKDAGLCPAAKAYDGGQFYKKYLLKVDFTDMANSTVKFDAKGDGLARYTVYNYQRDAATGKTDYRVVGKWYNELKMNAGDVMWATDSNLALDDDEDSKAASSMVSTVANSMVVTALSSPPTVDLNKNNSASSVTPPSSSSSSSSQSPLLPPPHGSLVSGVIPTSVCSLPCRTGQIMKMNRVSLRLEISHLALVSTPVHLWFLISLR